MYVILTDDILGFEINAMEDIFPKKSELDAMLDLLPSTPVDTSLAVIDPLALQSFSDGESISEKTNLMDSSGYTVFVRVAIAMLLYLSEDRSAARSNIWILRHLHSLAQYSNDLLKAPFAENPVFASSISHETLGEIASKVQQLSAYLLSPTMEEGWLLNAVPLLSEGKAGLETDGILQLLGELIRDPRGKDSIREARVLHTLLQQILAIATKSEAEQFILLARRIEKTGKLQSFTCPHFSIVHGLFTVLAPHAALAIIFSVTKYAPETQRLDRYRNELAASLLGIPSSRANTEGLWALRRLVAVAPDPESDIIFLPTPRAVNVMKACQQWITSDEDIDEEVESEMTMIFYYLAPILQNVAGAHWEFVYDVIENNLEVSLSVYRG